MNRYIYILFLFFSQSFGNTINIPSDYTAIQKGIDAAFDGDTVLVHPGTYYGPIDFERKNLVVGSLFLLEANESFISETIIVGTDSNVSPFVQIDGISEPEVELNGFTFQDISLTFGDETQSYALINILNASPKIINNRFNNFHIDGQAESAVILCNNSSSLIANNIFTDGMIALNYELTGWILSKNSSLNIINNLMENGYVGFADPAGYVVSVNSENIITANIFNNVSMGYCWMCAAIVALDGSSCFISNNLILRATGDGYGAVVASESQYVSNNNTLISNNGGYTNLFSDGVVKNDIIINYPNGWNNPIYLDEYSTIQISYSNVEGGYEGEGNIDISPLFIDAENDDYSLQEDSPCIDAGTADLDGDGTDDILDYYGLAPDMGAYEYKSDNDYDLGDINSDGELNILDIVLLVSFVLQTDFPTNTEFMAADFNADGTLNILDVVSIVDLILNPQVSIHINSGTSYGECWGYCVLELQLDNSNALFTASGWGWDDEFPDLYLEDNLSHEIWQQLVELIDFEYFQSLDDVYGCPDCADGGAEFIEIMYNGVVKQITFEAYSEIDGIEELIILLRDLRADYWSQINPN